MFRKSIEHIHIVMKADRIKQATFILVLTTFVTELFRIYFCLARMNTYFRM